MLGKDGLALSRSSMRLLPKQNTAFAHVLGPSFRPAKMGALSPSPPSSVFGRGGQQHPPSSPSSYDDMDALVAWPALEQFMEDLSDLDEQGNVLDRVDHLPRLPDMGVGRLRDTDFTSGMYGGYGQRSYLSQGRIPSGQYNWPSLNLPLGSSTSSLLQGHTDGYGNMGGGVSSCSTGSNVRSLPPPQLDPNHLVNTAKADARISSQISSLMRERVEGGGGSINSLLGNYGLSGLGSSASSLRLPGSPSPNTSRSLMFSDTGGDDGDGDAAMQQKQRFVWSPDLHKRFEAAVAQLGIEAAKPQAISQLMGVHGENAPTRQNIKSHLQKYRLLMKKKAAHTEAGPATAPAAASHSTASTTESAGAPRGAKDGEGVRHAGSGGIKDELGGNGRCNKGEGNDIESSRAEKSEERRMHVEENLYNLVGLPPLSSGQSTDDLDTEMRELGDVPMGTLAMLGDGNNWINGSSGVRPLSAVSMTNELSKHGLEQGPLSLHGQTGFKQGLLAGQGVQQGELDLPHGLLAERHNVLQGPISLPSAFCNSFDDSSSMPPSNKKGLQPASNFKPSIDISGHADRKQASEAQGPAADASLPTKLAYGLPSAMQNSSSTGVQRRDSSDGSMSTVALGAANGVSRHTSSDTWMNAWRNEDLGSMLMDGREPRGDGQEQLPSPGSSPFQDASKSNSSDENRSKRSTSSASDDISIPNDKDGFSKDSARPTKAEQQMNIADRQLAQAARSRDRFSREVERSLRDKRTKDSVVRDLSSAKRKRISASATGEG